MMAACFLETSLAELDATLVREKSRFLVTWIEDNEHMRCVPRAFANADLCCQLRPAAGACRTNISPSSQGAL